MTPTLDSRSTAERLATLEAKMDHVTKTVDEIKSLGWKIMAAAIASGAISPAVAKMFL